MAKSKLILMFVTLIALGFAITGCEEDNKIASAQHCLDNVDEANYTSAQACIDIIADEDSPRANVIKCSAAFLKGGLTTARIVQSVDMLSSNKADKEAYMITALSLNSVNDAKAADSYCKKTGLDGLTYLSNLAVIGTTIGTLAGAFGGFDPNNPDSLNSANMDAILSQCQSGNNCDNETVGNAVVSLGGDYCSSASADPEVCSEINQAIANGNGDPTAVGDSFFDLINKP